MERALRVNDPCFSTDLSTGSVDQGIALILQVALDTPLRRVFDYLPPAGAAGRTPKLGIRVRVPFGRRLLIGVLVGITAESSICAAKLKPALALLDDEPVFDPVTFDLLRFASDYYHHPLGEVIAAALPAALRLGQAADGAADLWSLSEAGRRELESPTSHRGPRQRALLAWLADRVHATADEVAEAFKPDHLKTLARRGWIISSRAPQDPTPDPAPVDLHPGDVSPTAAQTKVIDAITDSFGRYAAHLLYGVTGSGKTEVYLRVIADGIARGGQALVLVPEIALTPQLVDRFHRRFNTGIAVLHSALTGTERRAAWRAAYGGQARIVIGTRSAVFTALPRLVLIVVDEEHDASYKQHEGFRYSARDLAVWRTQRAQVPVVLGSATPSLETLGNAAQGRYAKHLLPRRPGRAQARQRSGPLAACDARDGTPSDRGRPGHRVLESTRLRALAVLECLRLGGTVRSLRRAHDAASARRAIALSPLRRMRARTLDMRQLRATVESGGPGHRASRGDSGAAFPGCAARPAGPGYGRGEGRHGSRFGARPARGGADSGRHANAHQRAPLSGGQSGGDPGCRSGPLCQRLSGHRTPGADHHAGRRSRRPGSPPGRSADTNRVSRASAPHAPHRRGL